MQTEHTPDVNDPRRENLKPAKGAPKQDEPHWRTMEDAGEPDADSVERMRKDMEHRAKLAGEGKSQLGDVGA